MYQEPNFNSKIKKCETMPSTLSHPSESSKLFIKPKKKNTHRNKMSDRTLLVTLR